MREASTLNAVSKLARDLPNGSFAFLVGHLVTVSPLKPTLPASSHNSP
jgi:hypothetical protein